MNILTMQAQMGEALGGIQLVTPEEVVEFIDLPNKDRLISRIRQQTLQGNREAIKAGVGAVTDVMASAASPEPDTIDPAAVNPEVLTDAFMAGQAGA